MTAQAGPKHVMDPEVLHLAGVYADALAQTLPDNDPAESVAEELEGLVALADAEPDLDIGRFAAMLNTAQRESLVRRIFAGRVSDRVEALLMVLARHDRLELIRPVARTFREILNERQGKVEVTVTTARPVDPARRREVAQSLAGTLDAQPLVTWKTDPSLLGGLTIQVGDRVVDASVASRLDGFRDALRNRMLSRPGPDDTEPPDDGSTPA
jgi:F-type H+-transporting ATPase subunit delta